MRLSYADKLKLAEQIGDTAPLKARLEPEYGAYLDRVDVEDTSPETCEGTTLTIDARPARPHSKGKVERLKRPIRCSAICRSCG